MLNFEQGKSYTIRNDIKPGVNYPKEEILKNIKSAIRRPLPQVNLYPPNDYTALVLCGGPTLNDHWDDIKKRRKKGAKVITMNGTHEAAIDKGITPSMFVMLDARPHNARFVARPQESCRYLLCSQVHPDVYDALEGYDVRVWHAGGDDRPEKGLLDKHYLGRWLPMTGGTSVGPRAIWLGYVLGIRKFHIYGLDSCLIKGEHHAYSQPENNFRLKLKVKVGRRIFWGHAWMVKQLDEWMQFLNILPEGVELAIHGDSATRLITDYAQQHGKFPKVEVLDTVKGD